MEYAVAPACHYLQCELAKPLVARVAMVVQNSAKFAEYRKYHHSFLWITQMEWTRNVCISSSSLVDVRQFGWNPIGVTTSSY